MIKANTKMQSKQTYFEKFHWLININTQILFVYLHETTSIYSELLPIFECVIKNSFRPIFPTKKSPGYLEGTSTFSYQSYVEYIYKMENSNLQIWKSNVITIKLQNRYFARLIFLLFWINFWYKTYLSQHICEACGQVLPKKGTFPDRQGTN